MNLVVVNEIQYRSSDNVDIRRKDNGVPFRCLISYFTCILCTNIFKRICPMNVSNRLVYP